MKSFFVLLGCLFLLCAGIARVVELFPLVDSEKKLCRRVTYTQTQTGAIRPHWHLTSRDVTTLGEDGKITIQFSDGNKVSIPEKFFLLEKEVCSEAW